MMEMMMEENEILIRAREAAAAAFASRDTADAIRRGAWDHGTTVGIAARALRDLAKPLSEIQPVDPDLVEARTLAVETPCYAGQPNIINDINKRVVEGECDDLYSVRLALAAIKRGRELALKARAE